MKPRAVAQGTIPIWPTWNGHTDEMTTRNIVISAFAGATLGAVSFTVRRAGACDACCARRWR
jgi:hypothetical protein